MPLQKIPLNEAPYKNVDEITLDRFTTSLIDGYRDEFSFLNKRPGCESFVDVGIDYAVDGLYWWVGREIMIAVCNGRIFKITDSDGTFVELTSADTNTLTAGNRVTFAEFGTELTGYKLFMASGGKIIYTTDALTYQAIADADAPVTVSHVAYINQRIFANLTTSDQGQYSNLAAPTTWSAADYIRAEASPDETMALLSSQNEIFMVGKKTTEVWYNDGITPYSRIAVVQQGTIAKHSAIFVENDIFLLNQDKKIVRLAQGRSPQIVSNPYDKFIQGFKDVGDAHADYIKTEGLALYVLTFPTANRTLVYNLKLQEWYEWGRWSTNELETLNYNRYIARCYAYSPKWDIHMIGSRLTEGLVLKTTHSVYQDNGYVIRTYRKSGHITHGTHNKKKSNKIIFRLKRGAVDLTVNPKFTVRWDNDRENLWSNEQQIDLGAVGDYELFKTLHRTGMYRSRQYEIIHSDNSPFVMGEVEEDVEVLDR